MEPRKVSSHGNPRLPEAEMEFRHYIPLQIRFNDIDMLGHVNNSVYLTFFDMGKTRYFEAVVGKIDFSLIPLVVVNVNCDMFEPTYFDDDVEMMTRTVKIGKHSITMEQIIVDAVSGHIKARCTTVMAGFDTRRRCGAELELCYIDAMEAFEGRPLRNIL